MENQKSKQLLEKELIEGASEVVDLIETLDSRGYIVELEYWKKGNQKESLKMADKMNGLIQLLYANLIILAIGYGIFHTILDDHIEWTIKFDGKELTETHEMIFDWVVIYLSGLLILEAVLLIGKLFGFSLSDLIPGYKSARMFGSWWMEILVAGIIATVFYMLYVHRYDWVIKGDQTIKVDEVQKEVQCAYLLAFAWACLSMINTLLPALSKFQIFDGIDDFFYLKSANEYRKRRSDRLRSVDEDEDDYGGRRRRRNAAGGGGRGFRRKGDKKKKYDDDDEDVEEEQQDEKLMNIAGKISDRIWTEKKAQSNNYGGGGGGGGQYGYKEEKYEYGQTSGAASGTKYDNIKSGTGGGQYGYKGKNEYGQTSGSGTKNDKAAGGQYGKSGMKKGGGGGGKHHNMDEYDETDFLNYVVRKWIF